MKALLEKLPDLTESSFKLFQFSYPYFPTPWHYHPEFELVLVTKSTGKRIIGNHIADFAEGDLVFIGSNVPHTYRNDEDYYTAAGRNEGAAQSIVIHFLPDFLGQGFLQSPEMAPVRALFDRAMLGLSVTGRTRQRVARQMMRLFEVQGMPRLLALLAILHELAEQNTRESADLETLSTQPIVGSNPTENDKLNRIMTYISQNYQQHITLAELADEVSMSVPSVCRFFKKRTRKTLVEFINELKISHACQLLMQSGKTVAEIGYESGFNNLSNFNRQFRVVKGVNPQSFRRQFLAQQP